MVQSFLTSGICTASISGTVAALSRVVAGSSSRNPAGNSKVARRGNHSAQQHPSAPPVNKFSPFHISIFQNKTEFLTYSFAFSLRGLKQNSTVRLSVTSVKLCETLKPS
jgi:hypothetical protein